MYFQQHIGYTRRMVFGPVNVCEGGNRVTACSCRRSFAAPTFSLEFVDYVTSYIMLHDSVSVRIGTFLRTNKVYQ